MRMRRDFGFSAACVRDETPRLSAPPAAAETLMKFLRVVDVMPAGACSALSRKATLRFAIDGACAYAMNCQCACSIAPLPLLSLRFFSPDAAAPIGAGQLALRPQRRRALLSCAPRSLLERFISHLACIRSRPRIPTVTTTGRP